MLFKWDRNERKERNVMKNRIIAFLSLTTVLFTGIAPAQTIQASDVNNPVSCQVHFHIM